MPGPSHVSQYMYNSRTLNLMVQIHDKLLYMIDGIFHLDLQEKPKLHTAINCCKTVT